MFIVWQPWTAHVVSLNEIISASAAGTYLSLHAVNISLLIIMK